MKNLKKYLSLALSLSMFSISAIAANIPTQVVPIGRSVGIKMLSNSAIVVKLSEINSANGLISPGVKAGIIPGDVIASVNGVNISKNEDLENIISQSGGDMCTLDIIRDSVPISIDIKPIQSLDDNKFKIGVWVRDSMAGIGTLTFADPETLKFGALGHGINDVDSGILMHLTDGTIVESTVNDVKKGVKGQAGELDGSFSNHTLGSLNKNTNQGIFGTLSDINLIKDLKPYPVATKSEITAGPAKVITNVEGNKTETFDIEIVKILKDGDETHRDMMIKITDPELIKKTGGIVQGMSGSPIVQNDKIIGAVTHVLINNPEKGYAIFVENMLNQAFDE